MERALAANGKLNEPSIHFSHCESLDNAGVLLLLPFLLENGLLRYKDHYEELKKSYYNLDFIILLLSFMFLCRIKKVAHLNKINSGDIGKLLGIDRVPEAKCFYKKISEIASQKKAEAWNKSLAGEWVENNENMFYYVDGHVQVYHGNKAKLGKKHVSRQRLCLPGVMQYWINNNEGLPYLYVTGEVNEKLTEMLENKIIPLLLNDITEKNNNANTDEPCFTLVFDRECSSFSFFKKIYDEHKIAILTYKKNVKDIWDENDFDEYDIKIDNDIVKMKLCEKEIVFNNSIFREIRKLTDTGHQTSIITTNKKISITEVAVYMFARWCQENFFKYMRQEYDLDWMFQSIVNKVDSNFEVVNPSHSKLTYQIKKIREKRYRREAKLYDLTNEMNKSKLENVEKEEKKIFKIKEALENIKKQEFKLLQQRNITPYKIKIKDMPEEIRYTKLNDETKHFMTIIKMICYRAETSFSILIPDTFKRKNEEKRDFAKRCIKLKGDIIPDYKQNTLTVSLYTMNTPRENRTIIEIMKIVNDSKTKFPGTDLTLYFKMTTS